MISKTLKESVIEANFGTIIHKVVFNNITCDKIRFVMADNHTADIDDMELYGLAINAAKRIKEKIWVLTDEGILVCGGTTKPLATLLVNINIDENVNTLASYAFRDLGKECRGFNVFIHGFHDETYERPWMWCVFK